MSALPVKLVRAVAKYERARKGTPSLRTYARATHAAHHLARLAVEFVKEAKAKRRKFDAAARAVSASIYPKPRRKR